MDTADLEPIPELLRKNARPLILFCVTMAFALALGGTVVARALMSSYHELESSATQQRAEQIYRAFAADLRQLEISNRDYAEWDTAQELIQTHDPTLISGNFSAETLLGMHVDVVWIKDSAGGDVFSSYVDRATGVVQSPAPRALLGSLRRFATPEASRRRGPPAERTLQTSQGLAGVSVTEITRSNRSQPTGGILLFARFIGQDEVARVSETSRLPVSIVDLPENGAPNEGLPHDVWSWARTGNTPTYARVIDDQTIVGYAKLLSNDGTPVALFATQSARSIHAIGVRTTTYMLVSVAVLFVAFGVIAFALLRRLFALQQRDVSHRRHAEELQRANRRNLIKQAQRDFLTGLPNRLFVNVSMPRLLARMVDTAGLLAVMHLDIDQFKNINDSRGHGRGDELLKVVGKRLRGSVSSLDLVARMGGDEFVIVASLLPDVAAIERLATRVQTAVAAEMLIDGQPVRVTASMGIALYPRDGTDMETLLKRADIALFQAKEAGRRCYRFFSADLAAQVSEQAVLEQELRRAIGTPQIYLDYQPIIDLDTGKVVSLEALMRWRHPERGLIPPAQFIPVAEKSGLILELGQHALEEVLAQQRAWLDEDVPVVPIAVNVSPLQVERVDFAALVAKTMAAAGVEPQWVRFEITESAMTKEPERLIGTLEKLRSMGSQVLLDDFGTGYSSLSYLNRLPIDVIKIDRAFVRDLGGDGVQSPVIPAVVEMARRLGLRTVAEGVETAAQAAALAGLGCDYAQGYFYSKPVLAHHCRSLLEHLRRERAISDTLLARVITT